jgi:Na+/H+ antiporter NhaC
MQLLITIAFLAIFASLGAALFFMLRRGGSPKDASNDTAGTQQRNKSMARALAVRVAVSVVLFICVLIAWKLGYIQPHGIPPGK